MNETRRGLLAKTLGLATVAMALLANGPRVEAIETPSDNDVAKPCRPTISCTADLTSPGTLELEGGASYAHGGPLSQWTFPLLLKQTVTAWLQIQIGSNGYTLIRTEPRDDYFDNLFVGPKFHLTDQARFLPSLSLSAEVSIPTFAQNGYVRTTDLFFVAYASKDIGLLHIDWNVGLNVWRLDDAVAQAYTSLALSTSLPANFGIEAEGYIFSSAGTAATKDGGIRGALTFSARPWLVFDAGADYGFFPSVRSYSIFGGLTVIPVIFWRPRG
jgi:hypothetical protein